MAAILSGLPPTMEKLTRGVLPKMRSLLPGIEIRSSDPRRALFVGLWPPMFWLIGDALQAEERMGRRLAGRRRSWRLTSR